MKLKCALLVLGSILITGGCSKQQAEEFYKIENTEITDESCLSSLTAESETVASSMMSYETNTEIVINEEETEVFQTEIPEIKETEFPPRPGYQNNMDLKEYVNELLQTYTVGELMEDRTEISVNYNNFEIYDDRHKTIIENNSFLEGTLEIIPLGIAGLPIGENTESMSNHLLTPIYNLYTIKPSGQDEEMYKTRLSNSDRETGMSHTVTTDKPVAVTVAGHDKLFVTDDNAFNAKIKMCINGVETDWYSYEADAKQTTGIKTVLTLNGMEIYSEEPVKVDVTAYSIQNKLTYENVEIGKYGVLVYVNNENEFKTEVLDRDYFSVNY